MSFLMRIHASRKLFLFGRYSLAMLLPKKWLTDLEAERGDQVALVLDRKRRRIIVQFDPSATVSPTPETKPTTANQPTEDTGLEPILPI